MPYVDEGRRKHLDPHIKEVMIRLTGPGDLNYAISRMANHLVKRLGKSYLTLDSTRGAINDAAAEFYRRVVAPYEDEKRQVNGDVYDC